MASKLKIKVNGLVHSVTASLDTPLLYVLHNELHLHGPRFGCGLAQCGACSVLLDGKEVARFGQVHPDVAAARKLKQDVYLAEIVIENLYSHELRAPHYEAIAKYPAVERDFSMLFPEGTEFEKMKGVRSTSKTV